MEWLRHPVTESFLTRLSVLEEESKSLILNGDAPGITEPLFLLREQIIGEVRGLRRLKMEVEQKIATLRQEETVREEIPDE